MSVSYSLSKSNRALAAAAAVGVLALLITARCLEPSATGIGTHQQLGLPPCTSVVLFGVRCPSCGMTTSWALATRGRLLESMQINAGGFLLVLIAIAYLPASCYFLFKGKSSRGGWFSLALAIALISALAIAIIQWCIRLAG